ncbi:OsmC family protein [Amycolatopsis albispora]|uniref:Osmotically inducible protein C n=1 Tax=Amycolatopsis albispora TaxID=1804986 RepID=A0A344LGQ8_9PSEU|nr:OsmC family protein [Amycolatopsis albispora]AXB47232.1 osmotically inducible protein C [Amycolatopsis albispora]
MGLEVERIGEHVFAGRNERGAEVRIGRKGQADVFSPAELLQIAAAGCAAVTAEDLVVRRTGEEAKFRVEVTADRNDAASELDAVHVTFDLDLSSLDPERRAALAVAVDRAIDRLCTVSRTLKKGIPVTETFPAG